MALEKILRQTYLDVQNLVNPPEPLVASDRHFLKALQASLLQPAVIAELKPHSPAAGPLAAMDYDPVTQAQAYERGGAAALSVLTEKHFFKGSWADLTKARAATHLPVLCKDFIVDSRQVKWARHAGADACLLIVAALDQAKLIALKALIESYQMLAMIEVHTEAELDRALTLNPAILLINNRNLWDLSMHPETTARLLPLIPASIPVISASGLRTIQEISALPARVQGVLIGSQLMQEKDPAAFLQALALNLAKTHDTAQKNEIDAGNRPVLDEKYPKN